VIDTVAQPLDVGIVRVRKLYEQFLRAIDQLVEPVQFVHFFSCPDRSMATPTVNGYPAQEA